MRWKKWKIEQLTKSRESRFLAASAAASLCRTCTKLCDRSLVIRCGPSHWRARDAPAALKNLVHPPENTFSTASAITEVTDLPSRSPHPRASAGPVECLVGVV